MKNLTKAQVAAAVQRLKKGGFRHPRNKSQPDGDAMHVSPLLSNAAISWSQNANNVSRYACGDVIPAVDSALPTGKIFRWDESDIFRDEAEVRTSRGRIPLVDLRTSQVPYECVKHVAGGIITEEDEASADPVVEKMMNTTNALVRKLHIRREMRFINAFMTSGKWTNEFTGIATGTPGATQFQVFDDLTNSDPVGVFLARLDTLMMLVDDPRQVTVTIPQLVWTVLRQHPQVLARMPSVVQGSGGPIMVSVEQFAALLGVGKVKVVRGVRTSSARRAATNTFQYLYSDTVLITYAPAAPSKVEPSAFYMPKWTGLIGGGNFGIRVRKFWDDHEGGWIIVAEMADTFVKTSDALGVSLINTLST